MRIGFAAILLVLWSVPCLARAQARPTATGPGSNIVVGGGVTAFQADYGQRKIGGGFAYTDITPWQRVSIEGEARWLRVHTSEDVTETNYLAGLKVPILQGRFQPYVKLLVGAGRINLPFNYGEGTFFEYAPGGGVDYKLTDRLAVRVIDFEYQSWPEFPYGALRPYGISIGMSFRVNPVDRYPHDASRARRSKTTKE